MRARETKRRLRSHGLPSPPPHTHTRARAHSKDVHPAPRAPRRAVSATIASIDPEQTMYYLANPENNRKVGGVEVLSNINLEPNRNRMSRCRGGSTRAGLPANGKEGGKMKGGKEKWWKRGGFWNN